MGQSAVIAGIYYIQKINRNKTKSDLIYFWARDCRRKTVRRLAFAWTWHPVFRHGTAVPLSKTAAGVRQIVGTLLARVGATAAALCVHSVWEGRLRPFLPLERTLGSDQRCQCKAIGLPGQATGFDPGHAGATRNVFSACRRVLPNLTASTASLMRRFERRESDFGRMIGGIPASPVRQDGRCGCIWFVYRLCRAHSRAIQIA